MKTLVWDSSFKRAFKRLIRKNPQLKNKIFAVLELLIENPYNPTLKAHKLKGQPFPAFERRGLRLTAFRGQLNGLWACWVEYDCRIIYTFQSNDDSEEELILLIDIGTHDEVY